MEEQEIILLTENKDEEIPADPPNNKYRNRALRLLNLHSYEDGTLKLDIKDLIKKHLI